MIQATEAMGKAIYQTYWSGDPKMQQWEEIGTKNQADWIKCAKAAVDLVPQPEVNELPALYLDGAVENCSFDTGDESAGQLVTLQVRFPLSARFHKTPGSTRRILDKLLKQAQVKDNVLRISVVDDARIKNEFARLQDDGSLRELLPEEGSW